MKKVRDTIAMKTTIDIMAKWVLDITFIILLSLMYYLNEPISSPKVIYIPKGSISNIITQLSSSGYDVTPFDKYIIRVLGSAQSGWIDIKSNKNAKADFLYKLTTSKAALRSVTLIPGETTYVFLDILAKSLDLDRDKLQEEYDNLSSIPEGQFVPNTYALPIGISEKMVLKTLFLQSKEQFERVSYKFFNDFNEKKWLQIVTIASIIQKESASIEEMPLVSSVIQNRLKKKMRLQMDGTLNYAQFSHTKVTAAMIREDESPYNTYKIPALPPYPVCNVSFDAIKAAVFPAKSDYLYFVKNKNGTHDFSCNYSTHLSNINK